MNPEILAFFEKKDPKIYKYMLQINKPRVLTKYAAKDYFIRLARAIAYQQLHGKAASTIWGRFEELFANNRPTIEGVLELSIEKMKECGLSNAKASYIKNIAEAFKNDANYNNLDQLSDEDVIELLTKIKGVGRWSAEMFLMFTLAREDIFSAGDFGLKKGLMKVYGMKKEPTKKRMEQITNKWKPYRTYGSLTLWSAVDIKEIVAEEPKDKFSLKQPKS